MKIIKDELVHDGEFIRVIRRHFQTTNGNLGVWEFVRRKHTYGRMIMVAAVTPEKELILERIFRVPLNDYVLELPAGLMDKEGESEGTAVRRELLEETGYTVDDLRLILTGPFNSGLLADEIALYLGTGAKKVQEPVLDQSEDIQVIKVPVAELLNYIAQQKDLRVDIKIPVILPYLNQF